MQILMGSLGFVILTFLCPPVHQETRLKPAQQLSLFPSRSRIHMQKHHHILVHLYQIIAHQTVWTWSMTTISDFPTRCSKYLRSKKSRSHKLQLVSEAATRTPTQVESLAGERMNLGTIFHRTSECQPNGISRQMGLGSGITLDTIIVPTEVVLSRNTPISLKTKCLQVSAGVTSEC